MPDCNEETSDAESDTPVVAAASTSRGPSPDELEEVDEFSLRHQATDAVPLAAFPMPSEQVAASQKALVLQGLDPRLIEAEIVDSTRTIPMDGPDAGPCLGSKTRMRMKELGITELFAGNIFYQSTSKINILLCFRQYNPLSYRSCFPLRLISVPSTSRIIRLVTCVFPLRQGVERHLHTSSLSLRYVGSCTRIVKSTSCLQLLSTRVVTRLRALVVLPTRDLVTQVRETFEAFCRGRGLKVDIFLSPI